MSLSNLIGMKSRQLGSPGTRGTGVQKRIPAPVGGWNTRDSLATMKEKYATKLDNFFPEAGAVTMRRGCQQHASLGDALAGAEVNSLFSHEGSSRNLMAVADKKLWDVTGSTPRQIKGSLNSEFWKTTNLNGNTIACSNGNDDPMRIMPDGTLANTHGWAKETGVSGSLDVSRLLSPFSFKGRILFIERDSANLWYGNVGAIQGDLYRYNLGSFHGAGGNIVNIGSLTIDAGSGIDDLLCVFFDNGSALVYQGTDIADPLKFALVGTWNLGRLVGDRSLVKVGGDLVGLTTDGYVSMLTLLTKGRVAERMASLSDAISSTVTEVTSVYSNLNTWDCILYTPASWLLFNLPDGSQHVMNTQTKAWCRFNGWNANCFAVHENNLFFGTTGKVCQANIGGEDDGKEIRADCQTAYNYLGSAYDKRFTLARPIVSSDGSVNGLTVATSSDFTEEPVDFISADIQVQGAKWNEAKWNEAKWSGGVVIDDKWQMLQSDGSALSIRVLVSTRNARVSFYSAHIIYEPTTGIL